MWWFFRIIFSSLFLLSMVLSIPVAFDVGGKDSGLAYSLALFSFYFFYSFARLITPTNSRVRWTITSVIRLSQFVVIPSLLIWALETFAVDASAGSATWAERTLGALSGRKAESWSDYVFGEGGLVETVALGGWDAMLSYSSPVFQLLEGFCSLLVIQAAGQMTRWLVNRGRSDTWMIILLVFSGSVLASSTYFLWRVVNFPQITTIGASLIGVTMTTTIFLGGYGITSAKGNVVESSLLFAYVVLCIYQIYTDYLPTNESIVEQPVQPEFPPLPPIIMASYSTFLHILSSLPVTVHSFYGLLYAAFQTITPSVMISLTYRTIVFYCATRIIPAVRESGASAILDDDALDDTADGANSALSFLSWFSPSILIAIYTSLLLQHFSASDDTDGWTLRAGDAGGSAWRWANVVGVISLYAVELYLGGESAAGHSHWKVD
ncbi:hypothetical protein TD95_003086 [Thielaviopsis punctulata]|uniref:ER membrane protein n=1 Tax=Thielaviopsis punctulata TaxID=72032 RepID=A0A0F4ZHX1_9PEZI|nr:hypothetical protein TD95_003086 [Thielaviopsis punctulata]